MFPVLFAIPRTSGWLAQWEEMLVDPEQKIARPRQIYVGYPQREVLPLAEETKDADEVHAA
jgi:citrate synthase